MRFNYKIFEVKAEAAKKIHFLKEIVAQFEVN